MEIKTDSSAAIGIACTVGIGKIRHIEGNQLWLQRRIAKGDIVAMKVDGEHNFADTSAEVVGGLNIGAHIEDVRSCASRDRHELAASLEGNSEEEHLAEEEGEY